MRLESLRFLKRLLSTPSPVGHEARRQRVWMDYMHSPVELVSLNDLEQIPRLLGALVRSVKKAKCLR